MRSSFGLGLGLWQLASRGVPPPPPITTVDGTLAASEAPDTLLILGGLPIWLDIHELPDIFLLTGTALSDNIRAVEGADVCLIQGGVLTYQMFGIIDSNNTFILDFPDQHPILGLRAVLDVFDPPGAFDILDSNNVTILDSNLSPIRGLRAGP